MNNDRFAELTAFEGPDDWVSLYLDGVGEDICMDAEVGTRKDCLFCSPQSVTFHCVVLDLQLADIPTEHLDLVGNTGMAAESIAPVTASDRYAAHAIGDCSAGYVSAWPVTDISYSWPVLAPAPRHYNVIFPMYWMLCGSL